MSDDVRTFFDGYASAFDSIYERDLKQDLSLSRMLRQSMRTRFELTFDLCRPLAGRSFLDLGCGSGQYAIFAAREGAARVTGVDMSQEMISLAREKAVSFGVEGACTFHLGDVTADLGIPPHDYCVALGVFDYIADPLPLLQRMAASSTTRLVASFPKRWHVLSPQRKVRYQLRNCPLYLYSHGDLVRLASALKPLTPHIFDLGRDYLLTAAAR